MDVKIVRVEPKWDNNVKEIVSTTYAINGAGLSKSQVKSLVRFVCAGMTSRSIGRTKTVDILVNDAIAAGSSFYSFGKDTSISIEVEAS